MLQARPAESEARLSFAALADIVGEDVGGSGRVELRHFLLDLLGT
jgi:hypothetical protein